MKPENDCNYNTILHFVISTFEMLIGTALTAAAFGLFIIPQGFASAGVTGLASVIFEYTPLSLSQTVFVINMLFLIAGLIFVGKAFTVKTIASSVLFPLMLQFFSHSDACIIASPILSVLVAGSLLGIGAGLQLRSGASSGGFSVLGVVLQNKFNVPVAVTLNITDAAIILIQVFRQSISQTVYGIIVITLSAFLVGKVVSARGFIPKYKQQTAFM